MQFDRLQPAAKVSAVYVFAHHGLSSAAKPKRHNALYVD